MIIQMFDVVVYGATFVGLFLSIFWLLVLLIVKDEEKIRWNKEWPSFTTIVPAYNEEEAIIKTLISLTQLDYPKEKLQIIVVNDGSTDKTRELVENFISKYSNENITLINQTNSGKGRAMNNGLRHATGEFFACLDADSFVEPSALKAMLHYFMDPEVAAVCPLMKVHNPKTVIEKVQWYEYVINMFYKYLNGKLHAIHVTPGPFSIYRTDLIRKLGGYDENTITEDLEIAIRLQKHNYKIKQTFDATVYTNTPKTWKSLFYQRVRWYRGSVDNSIKYKELIFNRKYGDFGVLRMPTIILSGIISIITSLFLLEELGTRALHGLNWLQAINFDVLPVIQTADMNVNYLMLPYTRYVVVLFMISIGLFIMVYSYRVIGEKITNHGKTFVSLLFYLFVYSLFLSSVWMYIGFQIATKGKKKWK